MVMAIPSTCPIGYRNGRSNPIFSASRLKEERENYP